MGNKQSGLIDDHPNSRKVTEEAIRYFGRRLPNLRKGVDKDYGNVETGGTCGGVALQRANWILKGICTYHWKSVGADSVGALQGACILTDMIWHFQRDGFYAKELDDFNSLCSFLDKGKSHSCSPS